MSQKELEQNVLLQTRTFFFWFICCSFMVHYWLIYISYFILNFQKFQMHHQFILEPVQNH